MLYQAFAAEGFDCLNLLSQEDYAKVLELDGTLLKEKWKAPTVHRQPTQLGQVAQVSDFPYLASYALVFTNKAFNALQAQLVEQLMAAGDFLPLASRDDEDLQLYNAPICDVIDYARSDIKYFADGTTIMRIKKYAFLPTVSECPLVFRAKFRASPLLYQEAFVKAYNESGLKGLNFKQLA